VESVPRAGSRKMGHVVKLMPFGAFVAIDDSDWIGLVKAPEISWQPVRQPQDVLSVGQSVEVEIVAFNTENGQISLSIKRCQPPE
jgi:small subunit ribosomal protein S1